MWDRKRWRTVWRTLLVCLIVYWLTLFVTTHIPSEYVDIRNMNDKVVHTLAYAGLAFLLAIVIVRRTTPPWSIYFYVFVAVVGYGAFDELSQQLARGRQADWADWYCDIAGAAAGITIVCLLQPLIRRKSTPEPVAVNR